MVNPAIKDVLLPRLAITLIFWSRFGAPHLHKYKLDADKKPVISYHKDTNLTGRFIQFVPSLENRILDIGRASECTIKLGFNIDSRHDPTALEDVYDEGGAVAQPLFNHWSRKHVTLELIIRRRNGRSVATWYVSPGGEFWNPNKATREWGYPTNHVYLEGKPLPGGTDNPAPLFEKGKDTAHLQLGDSGKIIIVKGKLGEDTTSWPDDIWTGYPWPNMVLIAQQRVKEAESAMETARHLKQEELADSGSEVVGRTLPDVLALVLNGPSQKYRVVWWVFCSLIGVAILWILER